MVTLVAAAITGVAVIILDLIIPPGSIPLFISAGRIVTSLVLLLVAAIASSAFSLARVLRIDPGLCPRKVLMSEASTTAVEFVGATIAI